MGVYPMLKDETCWFLAVDFDKEHWKRDAAAFWKPVDFTMRRRALSDPVLATVGMCGFFSLNL